MKRWLTTLLGVTVGGYMAVGLAARALVGGSGKEALTNALRDSMGVPVAVGAAGFDLVQWLRFRPALSLEDVTIGNPPGFKAKHLVEAKRMTAQVSLFSLFGNKIEVESIDVEQPRITVETSAKGVTNVEEFVKKLSAGSASGARSGGRSGAGLAIDSLSVRSGEIAAEGVNIHNIDIGLRDFQSDRSCRLEAAAKLFRGDNSTVRLEAQAGPFGAESLPLAGTLAVTVAPGEIPAAWRQRELGDLLGAPGSKARASLQASIQGDAYGALRGPAKLVLSDIRIGRDDKHVLPLAGKASLEFSASSLMSDPAFHLKIPNGQLKLGKGEWTGELEVRTHGAVTSGHSRGKISSVEINELVSSLTAARDKVQGMLELPYSIQFAGKNAEEIRRSLNGNGKLSIAKGRVAALDLVASIQRALETSQQETEGTKGSTPFTTLTADLTAAQSRLNLDGIVLEGPALRATGKGTIDFDQNIRFELEARVSGGVARLFNQVARRSQQEEATVPLVVSGTVDAPRVRPSVTKMATDAALGLLDSLFKKKKTP